MRKLSIPICVIMVLMLIVNGITFASSLSREPIQLSEDQKKELNTFFSNFSEAFLKPYEYGKINDEELVSFALCHLRINQGYRNLKRWDNYHWAASAEEVDYLANKYFGKVANIHRPMPEHPFVDGYYLSAYGHGEVMCFSQIKGLYDNGDGTFTAIVWNYYGDINPREQILGIKANADGSYTATQIDVYPDGTSRIWEIPRIELSAEYKAVIKPVYEGDSKRYILLEYLKTRDFLQLINGKVVRVPPEELKPVTN